MSYGFTIPQIYSSNISRYFLFIYCLAVAIGADKVIYNDLEDIIEAVASLNSNLSTFETSCFSGIYTTDEVTEDYLTAVESARGLQRSKS